MQLGGAEALVSPPSSTETERGSRDSGQGTTPVASDCEAGTSGRNPPAEPRSASVDKEDVMENRLTPHEQETLRQRHHAAINILPDLDTEAQRLDLLLAVVWPENERLRTFEDAA